MMSKRRYLLTAALLAAAMTVSAAALQREQAVLSEKLIRLHVVANSDSEADQSVKLMVRDMVLQYLEPMLDDCEDAEAVLCEQLPQLQIIAEDVLKENGMDHPVAVSLGYEQFPTRVYETFSLPAGIYRSLRITIGAGEGHNWWCVVFPAICLPAAGEMEEAAVEAGLTEKEISLITEENGQYVIKFKILELLQEVQKLIR